LITKQLGYQGGTLLQQLIGRIAASRKDAGDIIQNIGIDVFGFEQVQQIPGTAGSETFLEDSSQ
jgi:hypothetical protein